MGAARRLGPGAAPEVARVLCDAFADYPVMRYVLGETAAYRRDLDTLISFFVGCRVLRGDPMFGVAGPEGLVAAATLSIPDVASPDSVGELREETWARLGAEARARYESFGRATSPFEPDEPHVHLSMIGTSGAIRGHGCGRALLEAVHTHSAHDPASRGVSLTTEMPGNVALYRYFGYELVGEADVGGAFTSWGFYRRDAAGSAEHA